MKAAPKFKKGDRVVYKIGTEHEDVGVFEYIDEIFYVCTWDSTGISQGCFEESIELEHVAKSPLNQELK